MPSPQRSLHRSSSSINPDLEFTLRKQFNKIGFRPYQREIIQAALDGNDVFVQAATSFGKSLCFQLPAVLDQGSTLRFPLVF
jgi:superfamily II DNA helicase RecQ